MMKKTFNVVLFSAIFLVTASPYAIAQNGDAENRGTPSQQNMLPRGQQNADSGSGAHRRQDQGHDQQNQRHQNNSAPQQQNMSQRQANNRPALGFNKGKPLPKKYRGNAYRVDDWQKRGLQAPPSGHRWVRIDSDYVLIAITTGVVTSILLNQ